MTTPRDRAPRRARRVSRRDEGDSVLVALLKAAAYSQAPRLTFTVLHPKQAAQLKKLPFDLRTAYAPRLAAVLVAALALPAGMAIGRALERRAHRRAAVREAPRRSAAASGRERSGGKVERDPPRATTGATGGPR